MKKIGNLPKRTSHSRGSAIIEAMISVLIFSVGMIGLIGMQSTAIQQVGDAKFRADAAYMANQIIGTMWADRANLSSYAYRSAAAACTAGAPATTYAPLTNWVSAVQSNLPGTATYSPSISVNTSTNTVVVRICWAQPAETSPHSFVSVTQIK